MSYLRRKRIQQVAAEHEFYESPAGNQEAWSSDEDSLFYSPDFPGPREVRYLDSQNHSMATGGIAVDDIEDHVDWAIGGIPGMTKFVGSSGVTDPSNVDRHDFAGEMALFRRMPDTNYGPVKTSDHNSLLSLLYAMQESNHYFPNDVSQADIIKAV